MAIAHCLLLHALALWRPQIKMDWALTALKHIETYVILMFMCSSSQFSVQPNCCTSTGLYIPVILQRVSDHIFLCLPGTPGTPWGENSNPFFAQERGFFMFLLPHLAFNLNTHSWREIIHEISYRWVIPMYPNALTNTRVGGGWMHLW